MLGLLDLPLPQDGQHESGAYAIAYGAPWPGYLQLYRSADGQGFAPDAVIEGPAAIGETLTALQRGVTGRWDHANQFEVRMISGSLASLSDSAVLAGGNLIAIEGAPDRFELLQFARAELIADNTWRLSRLLRGQFGSDAEMADVIAAGARVVVIDGALTPVGVGLNELGRALSFRAVPPGAGLDSERTASASFTFAGQGLRPLSPVHLRGRRLGNGDIALSWIRRTRLGGDSWHLPDVPLGEASEAYAVRILGAEGEVIREMAATGPALVYPAGLQIEDFGALPPQITVEVAQVSAIWGAGAARRKVIHV